MLPAWADVLIPAIAALLGAAIGGYAAYRGAAASAQIAGNLEQRAWVRSRRENAYVALLTSRNKWVSLYVAKGHAMQEAAGQGNAQASQFPFDHWNALSQPVSDQLEQDIANVELFGSAAARSAAQTWVPALHDQYQIGTRPGGSFGAGIELVEQAERDEFRDPFLALVRGELGIED